MKRRALLLAAGAIAVAPRLHAQSQRVRRVGLLNSSPTSGALLAALGKRLGELGWIEGQNLVLEVRSAENRYDRLPALAKELVDLKVDVLVAVSTPAALAARQASAQIPIVFTWIADPVASGLVASLPRPGGNATGLSNVAVGLFPKQFEVLKALNPKLQRVAALGDPSFPGYAQAALQLRESAAAAAGVSLVHVVAQTVPDLDRAFAAAASERASAMVIPSLPLYGSNAGHIAQLGIKHRIMTATQARVFAAAGALFSFGSDLRDGFLRVAPYVNRILRGAKPAELPVEQADRFELILNRKTAAALGITIPQSLLLQATEVIE
jgi:putative ABC transport system substrate-binding protein